METLVVRGPFSLLLAASLVGCGTGNFGATVTASGATTSTTLAASATSVVTGTFVTLNAMVSPTAAAGTVAFLDGTTSLGSAPVSAGQASLPAALANGSHPLTAAYSGTTGYYASSSPAVTVLVSPSLTVSSITLTVTPSSGSVGTNVVFLATATTGATGLVTFYDGTTMLGSALLSGSTAIYSSVSLASGSHSITAVNGGSSTFSGSTSAAVVVTLK